MRYSRNLDVADILLYICIVGLLLWTMFGLAGGCSRNVNYVKAHAEKRYADMGMEVVAYEGYQIAFSTFCGGNVWYLTKRKNSDIIYRSFLCKWGDELHMYSLEPYVTQQIEIKN